MNDTVRIYPNLFVVGAMKAGSTSLYELLASSPDVWMCPIKEPNHFCSDIYKHPDFVRLHTVYPFSKKTWISDRGQYLKMFVNRIERYVGEASPTYLNSLSAAAAIQRFNPTAKILITLRNPVERAYSEYEMNRVIGIVTGSFSTAIRQDLKRYREGCWNPFERYITASCYYLQVKRYFDLFPREQISVHIMDRPKSGFQSVAEEVERFLEIELRQSVRLLDVGANVGVRPRLSVLNRFLYRRGIKEHISRRFPESIKKFAKHYYYGEKTARGVSEADSALLWGVFRSDVDSLSALIQQDLSHWQ
jgi:hypothetical protein